MSGRSRPRHPRLARRSANPGQPARNPVNKRGILHYVMLLALLVFSCIERRVRQSPEPLPTSYRGAVARPTGQLILHQCRGIQVLWRDDGHRYLAVPAAHRPALRVILQALGVSEAIYTTVPARAAPIWQP